MNLLPLALLFFLSACATPAMPLLNDSDYGPPPTDPEGRIKAYFDTVLKDPFSAQYRFSAPHKGITRYPPIMGSKFKAAGWFVEVQFNAKNAFGAYTGWQDATFVFKDQAIIEGYGIPVDWPAPR